MKKVIGSWILIGVGLLMLLGFFINASKKGVDGGDIAAALFLGVAPVAVGGILMRSSFKEKQQVRQNQQNALAAQREKEIIRLAQKTGGRLSIPDIVAGTSMNTVEADEIMREMTTRGYVNMQVTDDGVIMYEFYEIVHRNSLQA